MPVKKINRRWGWILLFILTLPACVNRISSSAVRSDPVIYPPPPAETRLQYLTSFSSSEDVSGKQKALNRFLFGEEAPVPLVKPFGIAVQAPRLFICDPGIKGLEIIDLENKTFTSFIPKGLGELQLPLNCAVDRDGTLFVADSRRRQVVVFDQELNYVRAITLADDARPTDLAVDEKGLWVTAIDRHQVFLYDRKNGELLERFPSDRSGTPGYLYQPVGICLNDSFVYVSDVGACKVQVYSKDLRYAGSFGEPGNAYGQFTRPKGIAVDDKGNVLVVDAAFENVQVFSPEGELLLPFGGTYRGPGGMWLPAGIETDTSCLQYFTAYADPHFTLRSLVFVCNQYGPDKISVYGFVSSAENPGP